MAADLLKEQFEKGLLFVFPENCFEELVIKFNVFHPKCPSMVLSRLLGLGVVAGSVMLFVPQILKIYASKSAKGISLFSQLLALIGSFGTAAYSYSKGFVFSQWGDAFFVTIQLVIVIMQILYYSDASAYAFSFFALCWAATFAVIGAYIPMEVLIGIQAAGIPIVFVSKSIQAYQNYQSQSTGQLSLISVFLQFAGTVARVFTSVQDTGDNLLIISYGSAAALNALIFAQFFLYWNADKRKKMN